MKPYEDPINYELKQICGSCIVHFERLSEIGQGSPVVGDMYVNGRLVQGHRFGGPILYDKEYIYAPVFVNRFFKRGFKLAIVNFETLEVRTIGSVLSLIYLYKIDDGKVYFYEDVIKSRSGCYALDND